MRLTKTQEGLLNAELVAGGPISNVCGATFFMRPFSAGQLNAAVRLRATSSFSIAWLLPGFCSQSIIIKEKAG